jgi:hypothetical protein
MEVEEAVEEAVEETAGGGHPRDLAGAIPAVPAPIPPGHQTDKFIGVAPQVFTGDRTTTEDFLIQWETYCRS